MSTDKKLIAIPTTLRLEVPSDMSDEAVRKMVQALTYGDFAIYPDNQKGSLASEVFDHALTSEDKDVEDAIKQVTMVDLWSSENSFKVVEL